MRALILVMALVCIGLSASIVAEVSARPSASQRSFVGEPFDLGRMLLDCDEGEGAVYGRETAGGKEGARLHFRVLAREGTRAEPPRFRIENVYEANTSAEPPVSTEYVHDAARHGWLPLTTPQAPERLDRLWVVRSISREEILFRGKPLMAWRVDLIDPALPEDEEAVVAWMHEEAPVFGLLRFKRRDDTWTLLNWRPGA